jgi:hypothetical protein
VTTADPGGPPVASPGTQEGNRDGSFRNELGAGPGTALIAGLTTAWLVLLFLDLGPPLDLVALAYLLVVPGLAVTRAAGLRTSAASLSLAVVLSVGLVGLLQAMMIAAGNASALLLRALIVILVLGALVVDEYLASPRRAVTLERLAEPGEIVAPTHRTS